MPRIDYTFYCAEFHGSASFENFARMISRAWDFLCAATFQRIRVKTLSDEDQRLVNLCCCALVDTLLLNESGGGIASESNDGVSVSYVAGSSESNMTNDDRMYKTAQTYLADTGLLYRG